MGKQTKAGSGGTRDTQRHGRQNKTGNAQTITCLRIVLNNPARDNTVDFFKCLIFFF